SDLLLESKFTSERDHPGKSGIRVFHFGYCFIPNDLIKYFFSYHAKGRNKANSQKLATLTMTKESVNEVRTYRKKVTAKWKNGQTVCCRLLTRMGQK
ncbi:MAG: hypothetical protein ACI4QT_04980, partial [Kiritimatiellia bacterium]